MPRQLIRNIEVRWGDLDAQNHVNNAVFMTYLEEARLAWLNELDGPLQSADSTPVLVNINCNFRRELGYPASLRITLTASQPSARRLVLAYTVADRHDPGTIYADAETTVVWIDRHSQTSIPVPAAATAWLSGTDNTEDG